MLNVVAGEGIPVEQFIEKWLQVQKSSLPIDHTGCLKIFSTLKVPMDLFPALPNFQLQLGQSCRLPFVIPRVCGLLGFEEHDLLLTDCTFGHGDSAKVYKVVLIRHIPGIERRHFRTDIHFDASMCSLLFLVT